MSYPRYLELRELLAKGIEIDLGGDHRLFEDISHYRIYPPNHILKRLEADEQQPEIYGRQWKVHISLVDATKGVLKTEADKQRGQEIIGRAWDAILPIVLEHHLHAKVIASNLVGEGSTPAQGKKNIILYYDKLDETPEKWRLMLTQIEKALRAEGLPTAGAIPGDKPIKGSRYMHFSSRSKSVMGDRVEAEDRTEEHLKGSPFDNIEINAEGPLPPYNGGAGGKGMRR